MKLILDNENIFEELCNLNKTLATVIKKKRKKTEKLKLRNEKIIRQRLKRIFGAHIYVNILQMVSGIHNVLEKKIDSK